MCQLYGTHSVAPEHLTNQQLRFNRPGLKSEKNIEPEGKILERAISGFVRTPWQKVADTVFKNELTNALREHESKERSGFISTAAIIGCRTSFMAEDLSEYLGAHCRLLVFDNDDNARNSAMKTMPGSVFRSECELLPYTMKEKGISNLDLVICKADLNAMPLDLCSRVISGIRWSLSERGELIVLTSSRRASVALDECFSSVKPSVSFASVLLVFRYVCRALDDNSSDDARGITLRQGALV